MNSVQTGCIAKGKARKGPVFWRFSGGFDFLRCACSRGIPVWDSLDLTTWWTFWMDIYIYICCRKGIWSPRGGDLVPETLPTAEPSILARGIQEKKTGWN